MFWPTKEATIALLAASVMITQAKLPQAAGVTQRVDEDQLFEVVLAEGPSIKGMFSQCSRSSKVIQGNFYSITVSKDVQYTRRVVGASDRPVEWQHQDGIVNIYECAIRADKEGAPMFYFTKAGGCGLVLNEVYGPSETDCDGEGSQVVYVSNAAICVNDGKPYKEGDVSEETCPRNCTVNGWEAQEVSGFQTILYPEKPPNCCPVDGPCLVVANNILLQYCAADDFCRAFGLVIPPVDTAQNAQLVFRRLQAAFQKDGKYAKAYVAVAKGTDGVWHHATSQQPVEASLWGAGEPTDVGPCALATNASNLVAAPCEGYNAVLCREPANSYQKCSGANVAFLNN